MAIIDSHIPAPTAAADQLRCPEGHPGPYFYIERLEYSQLVESATGDTIILRGVRRHGLLDVVGERVLECRECCSQIHLPVGCEVENS